MEQKGVKAAIINILAKERQCDPGSLERYFWY